MKNIVSTRKITVNNIDDAWMLVDDILISHNIDISAKLMDKVIYLLTQSNSVHFLIVNNEVVDVSLFEYELKKIYS